MWLGVGSSSFGFTPNFMVTSTKQFFVYGTPQWLGVRGQRIHWVFYQGREERIVGSGGGLLGRDRGDGLNGILGVGFEHCLPKFLITLNNYLVISIITTFVRCNFTLSSIGVRASFMECNMASTFRGYFAMAFFLILLCSVVTPTRCFDRVCDGETYSSCFTTPVGETSEFGTTFVVNTIIGVTTPLLPTTAFFTFGFNNIPSGFRFSVSATLIGHCAIFTITTLLSI